MQILNTIVLIGGAAAALISIVAVIRAVIKVLKTAHDFIHGLDQKVNTLVEHDQSQYLAILRLTIVNECMPISERLLAGKKYIEKGGNGDVRALYEELEAQCQEAVDHRE